MGLMANVFISALVVVISRVTVRDKVTSFVRRMFLFKIPKNHEGILFTQNNG